MPRGHAAWAALSIAGMLACLLLVFEAGQRIYAAIGPSKAVATADGGLMVVSHGAVHLFRADGTRFQRIDLDLFGRNLPPSDAAVHRDGRIVITNPDGSSLVRCRPPAGPCETIDPGLTRTLAQVALPLNSVKVWIDEDRQRYYLSDNAGHRIVIADFGGRVIDAGRAYAVQHPNQLQAFGNELVVADTDHKRLATFDITRDRVGGLRREMSTNANGIARNGRRWPFDAVVTPSGETWVLLAADRMRDADLVIFDVNGIPRRRIDMGDDADPFDIELWNNRIVVADAMRFRLDMIGLDGRPAPGLADPTFAAELEEAREAPERWKAIRLGAQVGVVFFPVLGIVMLRKRGAPVSSLSPIALDGVAPAELTHEVHWIDTDPGLADRAHRQTAPLVAGMVAMLAAFVFLFRDTLVRDPFLILQIALIGIALVFAVLRRPPRRSPAPAQFKGLRIGASRRGFHYRLGPRPFTRNQDASVPWKDVFFDGRRLLAGKDTIPVVAPLFGDVFHRAEFQRWILAHIPPANRVSADQLTWRSIKAAGPVAWITVALFAAIMVLIILLT